MSRPLQLCNWRSVGFGIATAATGLSAACLTLYVRNLSRRAPRQKMTVAIDLDHTLIHTRLLPIHENMKQVPRPVALVRFRAQPIQPALQTGPLQLPVQKQYLQTSLRQTLTMPPRPAVACKTTTTGQPDNDDDDEDDEDTFCVASSLVRHKPRDVADPANDIKQKASLVHPSARDTQDYDWDYVDDVNPDVKLATVAVAEDSTLNQAEDEEMLVWQRPWLHWSLSILAKISDLHLFTAADREYTDAMLRACDMKSYFRSTLTSTEITDVDHRGKDLAILTREWPKTLKSRVNEASDSPQETKGLLNNELWLVDDKLYNQVKPSESVEPRLQHFYHIPPFRCWTARAMDFELPKMVAFLLWRQMKTDFHTWCTDWTRRQ